MFIGCTGKVAKYLHIDAVEESVMEDQFYCWQVTQFTLLGEEILLFMNVYTRFPLFMRDVDDLSIPSLQQRFTYLFLQVMHSLHIPQDAIELYLGKQHWTYGKILDRSVLSQMNDLAYIYKFNAINGNHSYYHDGDASLSYADIPCIKANIYPKDKMREAMEHLRTCKKEVS